MSVPIAPAFANDTKYSVYEPSTQPQNYLRARSQPFQFPNVQGLLIGKIPNNLIVVQPIQITVEVDEDQSYLVSDDIFLVYGHGDNRVEALTDYAESLAEFYELLENGAKSNPFDKKLFAHLQSYIQQRGTTNGLQTDRS